jgi:hypothetical protein
MSYPQQPNPPTVPERGEFAGELDVTLNGVEGRVRASLVKQINKILEKNPEIVVNNMRNWLHEGRVSDD